MKLEISHTKVARVIIDLENNTVEFEERTGFDKTFSPIYIPLARDGRQLKFAQVSPAGHALTAFLKWAQIQSERGN